MSPTQLLLRRSSNHKPTIIGWPAATGIVTSSLLVLALFSGAAGCYEKPTTKVAAPTPPPSPETRYERFLMEFQRRLDSNPGVGDRYRGGGTSYNGNYQIAREELVKPATAGGVYRAQIDILVNSSFTVFQTEDPQVEEPQEERTPDAFASPEDELLDAMPGLEGVLRKPRTPIVSSAVQTRDDEETIVCKLAFVDGRWRLKTDLKDMLFLSAAFRLALEQQ